MELWEIAVIVAFTSAGATVHASVGLGVALVAGPALLVVDPAFLPGPMIVATMLLTVRHLVAEGGEADLGVVRRASLGVPAGLVLGFGVVAFADESMMRIVVGAVIVIASGLLLAGAQLRRSPRTDVVGGGAFSFSLLAAGIPGPAAAIAFNDLKPSCYRGTIGYLGIPVSLLSLGLLVTAGEFGSHELELTAWVLPGIGIGLVAARFVRPHLDRAWFRPAVLWVALLGGAAVVVRQLVG